MFRGFVKRFVANRLFIRTKYHTFTNASTTAATTTRATPTAPSRSRPPVALAFTDTARVITPYYSHTIESRKQYTTSFPIRRSPVKAKHEPYTLYIYQTRKKKKRLLAKKK